KIVLQRGSVIGRTFWAGAIDHLSPEYDSAELEDMLDDLLLRDFLKREERSTISGESVYRFKHVLIREVAYSGLSKSGRAEYHTRFAEWLRERADKELLEIRAYHLDHACALYAELDGKPPEELARTAAKALTAAGKRALSRESNVSARKLLLRAAELEPTLERRFLAARAAWQLGDLPVVRDEMTVIAEEAAASGARDLQSRALTALSETAASLDGEFARAAELADQALEVVEDYEQAEGWLTKALDLYREAASVSEIAWTSRMLGIVAWEKGDVAKSEKLLRESIRLLAPMRERGTLCESQRYLAQLLLEQGRIDEAEKYALAARETVSAEDTVSRATTRVALAQIRAAQGRDEEAETLFGEALEIITGGEHCRILLDVLPPYA